MRIEIPPQVFYRLNGQQMAVANAVTYKARAMHWMAEARTGPPELRSMTVAFARAAHHAYLKAMRRAVRYAEHIP